MAGPLPGSFTRHNTAPTSTFATPVRPAVSPAPSPGPEAAPAESRHPSIHLPANNGGSAGGILERHIRACFLTGSCADVRIRVGRWRRSYDLHKVVLIQAEYFAAMFCGGFAEGEDEEDLGCAAAGGPVLVDQRPSSWTQTGEREVELHIEDPNISRAAFEILIARLYSTGPPLHLSAVTHPTAQSPLSPSFPFLPASSSPIPAGTQPATPRFLLSLLATSIFLGLPGVTQSVLHLILGNVSPWSINVYLGFAIGRGIGSYAGEDWEDGEEPGRGAVGLENLGRVSELRRMAPTSGSDRESMAPGSHQGMETTTLTPTPSPTSRHSAWTSSGGSSTPRLASPAPSTRSASSSSSSSSLESHLIRSLHSLSEPEASYFYGLPSARIGEACAAWLCKWGTDVLDVEERTHAVSVMGVEERFSSVQLGRRPERAGAQPRAVSARPGSPQSSVPIVFPPLFSLGGLPATWIRAVISSDAFFVGSELERYKVARRVYELRRTQREAQKLEQGRSLSDEADRDDEEELEEEEFEGLFATGCLYSHLAFEDLAYISSDLNPSSGTPYAPLTVLQTSLWQHQELKSRIQTVSQAAAGPLSPGSASSASSTDGTEELGIAVSASGVASRIERASQKEHRRQRRRSRSFSRLSIASGSAPSTSAAAAGKGKQRQDRPEPITIPSSTSTLGEISGLVGGELAALSSRRYWPVPSDDTSRLGAWGGFVNADISKSTGPDATLTGNGASALDGAVMGAAMVGAIGLGTASAEADFFGIGSTALSGAEIAAGLQQSSMDEPDRSYTDYEPFRFGVVFHDIERLKEKQRLYSETRGYAGNWFNLYVQQIRRKDRSLQLGLYLHRQSPNEPIPQASAPPQLGRLGPGGFQDATTGSYGSGPSDLFAPASHSSSASGSSLLATSPMPVVQSFAALHPHATGSAPSASRRLQTANLSAAASTPVARGPALAFRDERKACKLWFKITACSSLGTALTCFSSTPEAFASMQSFGWRSSSLRTEEYISPAEGFMPEEDTLVWSGQLDEDRLKCLRATVVLGLV